MSSDKLDKIIINVDAFLEKLEVLKRKKEEIEKNLDDVKNKYNKKKLDEASYKKELDLILRGKKEQDVIGRYNKDIRNLLEKIQLQNRNALKLFEIKEGIGFGRKKEEVLDVKEVREFVKGLKKTKGKIKEDKYLLYKKNAYGQLSNQLFKDISLKLTKKYPGVFKGLYRSLRVSNMRVFSDTYISMALLSGLIFFILFYAILIIFVGINSVFSIFRYFLFAILASVLLLVVFYYWPKIVIDGRRKEIKNDLPFAIIHLAAIAGSGAPIVNAFNMLLKSGEYKALNGEIKRIMNYVNLFGYNLTNALKTVADTTPSKEFKELLNGMRSTIESGGNIKLFLKNKARDTFGSYKNERKKYVETLATYSDIYTAVLIAAPLLFIIVLVLVGLVGNRIGGLDIKFIEKLGIYFVVPAFNIAFIVFLNIMQPDL